MRQNSLTLFAPNVLKGNIGFAGAVGDKTMTIYIRSSDPETKKILPEAIDTLTKSKSIGDLINPVMESSQGAFSFSINLHQLNTLIEELKKTFISAKTQHSSAVKEFAKFLTTAFEHKMFEITVMNNAPSRTLR